MSDLTDLLRRAHAGDEAARQDLFAVAYDELRKLAHARLSSLAPNMSLDTTTLVHESFIRFVQAGRLQGSDRGHFFSYAGHVMRSVIVDYVRRSRAQRRGGDIEHVALDTDLANQLAMPEDDVMQVHQALERLERAEPALAQLVELRYFAGLDENQIGDILGMSTRTVEREWKRARLLLAAAIG